MSELEDQFLVSLVVETTMRAGREAVRIWHERSERSPIIKAASATAVVLEDADDIDHELLEHALKEWGASGDFAEVCEHALAGGSTLTDEGHISNFLAAGGIGAIPQTLIEAEDEPAIKKVAGAIVSTFFEQLRLLLLRSEAGNEILYRRVDAGFMDARRHHLETHEVAHSQSDALQRIESMMLEIKSDVVAGNVSTEEKDFIAQLNVTGKLINTGRFSAASTVLEQLVSEIPEGVSKESLARFCAQRGACALAFEDLPGATDAFTEAIEHQPNSATVKANAATVHLVAERYELAMTLALEALAVSSTDDQAHSVRLAVLFRQGNHDLAHALHAEPELMDKPRCLTALAQCFYDIAEFRTVQRLSERAEAVEESNPNAKILWASAIIRAYQEDSRRSGVAGGFIWDTPLDSLRHADALLTEVVEGLDDGVGVPALDDTLSNRATVRSMLGQENEALADLNRVLATNPAHPTARLNRGVLLAEAGRHREALDDFEAAIERGHDDQGLELVVARTKFQLGQSEEAIDLASHVLETAADPHLRSAAAETLIRLYLAGKEADKARTIAAALEQSQDPAAVRVRAFYLEEIGSADQAIDLLVGQLETLTGEEDVADLLVDLGEVFFRRKRWADCCLVLEWVTDVSDESQLLEKYAIALMESAQLDKALQLTRTVRENWGPRPVFTEIEARILEDVGSLADSRDRLYELAELLNQRSDLLFEIARLSLRLGERDVARSCIERLQEDSIRNDGRLLMATAELRQELEMEGALELGYRARRLQYGDSRMHLAYIGLCIRSNDADLPIVDRSEQGTTVLLERDSERLHFTLVDDDLKEPSRNEIDTDDDVYALLVGLRVGDIVALHKNSRPFSVASVISNLAWAHQDSLERLQTHFPRQEGLRAISVEDEGMAELLHELDLRAQRSENAVALYRSRALPLGMMTNLLGTHLYDVWRGFTAPQGPGLLVSRGSDLEEELSALDEANGIVLDPVAIFTLCATGLFDEVLLRFSRTVFSQLGLEHIAEDISERKRGPQPSGMMGKQGDEYVFSEYSSEVWESEVKLLEGIRDSISDLEIRNADPASVASVGDYRRLRNVLGPWGLDALLLSRDEGLVLCADDLGLRAFGETQWNMRTVSTHSLATHLFQHQLVNEARLAKARSWFLTKRYKSIPFVSLDLAQAVTSPGVLNAEIESLLTEILGEGEERGRAALTAQLISLIGQGSSWGIRRQWLRDKAIAAFLHNRDIDDASELLIVALRQLGVLAPEDRRAIEERVRLLRAHLANGRSS